MGLFSKFKAGLAKTHAKLTHELKRIITRSPKLTAESLEEIEHALIAADLGMPMTSQIVAAVKKAYETLINDKSLAEKKVLFTIQRGPYTDWKTLDWTKDYLKED